MPISRISGSVMRKAVVDFRCSALFRLEVLRADLLATTRVGCNATSAMVTIPQKTKRHADRMRGAWSGERNGCRCGPPRTAARHPQGSGPHKRSEEHTSELQS